MKTTNKIILLISAGMMLLGCTHNFEEINSNPNKPDKLNQPELLLGTVIKGVSKLSMAKSEGAVLGDYSVDQYTSMFNDAFNNTNTGSFYYDGRNIQEMIDLAEANNRPHTKGIGYVIKSYIFQQMTDAYGDFPYSEALRGKSEGIFEAKYDTQEEIYEGILLQLEEANELLSKQSVAENLENYDNLYKGDVLKWRKFANSLRLRMLVRMSGQKDVGAQIQQIVNQPDKYPLIESNDDNAVFNYNDDLEANWSPLYRENDEKFSHTLFLSTTLEYHFRAMNDPRLKVLASPTVKGLDEKKYIYAGVPNCLSDGDEAAYNGGDNSNSRKGYIFVPRDVDKKYASPTAAQGILITYSEVQFCLAEAREKGWITSGDAATYYKNGIAANFEYWASRIPDSFKEMKATMDFPPTEVFEPKDALPDDSYYEQPRVAYTGTQAEKLEKIGVQKWIALYLCSIEGWSEWRRTGFPKEISVNPPRGLHSSSNISEWPRRIPYPHNETVYNAKQYKIAVDRQGADNLLTRVWWNR